VLLNRHHEAIEFDLHRWLGMDLLDFWRGRISARKLLVLLLRLPAESEFKQAVDPDGTVIASWRPTDYILADLFDLTRAVAGAKNQQTYPRPTRELLAQERDKAARVDEGRRRLVERYEARQRKETT
jgi:hypothetical protein